MGRACRPAWARRAACLLAGTLGVGWGAPVASAAVVPNAAYGGGGVSVAAPVIGLRVSGRGDRAAFEAQAIARCPGRSSVDDRLTVRAPLRPTGTFRGTATRSYRPGSGESRTVTLSVSGVASDAQRASGSLRLVVLVRRGTAAAVRCDSGSQRWQGRPGTSAQIGAVAPRPDGTYFGATSQGGRYVPFPFVLAVSADARRVDTTLFRVFRSCVGARSDDLPNNTPGGPIAADGSFFIVQRYSQRFSDSVEDYTFTVRGRVGADAATGTLRATSVLRDPRTRRTIGRCDSGPLLWSASP